VQNLLPSGFKGMVFGDIYLQEHKDWVERVCSELGIEAIEPLWGKDTEEVLCSFIEKGFEAVIVSAQSELIEEDWVGKRVNRSFLNYLKRKNLNVCGENGEYHTLVMYGPIFKRPIQLIETRTIIRGSLCFLGTVKYQLGC
jgi:diphthine-ammonia ligase